MNPQLPEVRFRRQNSFQARRGILTRSIATFDLDQSDCSIRVNYSYFINRVRLPDARMTALRYVG